MKQIFFFLFCCSLHYFGMSQNKFEGIVLDKATNEPIELVNVVLNAAKQYQTNREGSFAFLSGNQQETLTLSHIGYESVKVTAIENKKNIFYLQKGIVNLKDIALVKTTNNPHTVISKLDINLQPIKSAQDLLRMVPGLFISQHQGGGKAEQIFLRGFDIDHGTDIQITVDGLPVNMVSHAHGQGYADLHFVIPELIKKIDYGKGPYYTEQGNLSTAGYVNFQTTQTLEQSKISIEGGQFNTYRGLAMLDLIKKNKSNQNAFIAGEYLFSNGPFISKQGFHRMNLIGKYNAKINANHSLHLMTSFFDSKWNASGQIPKRAVFNGMISRFGSIDDREGGNTSRMNASIALKSKLGDATIEQQIYYTHYTFNLFSNFTFFLNDSINGDQIKQAEKRDILGYNGKLHFKLLPYNKGLSTIGVGFRYDQTKDSELSRTKDKVMLLDRLSFGNVKEKNLFLFADQNFRFNKLSVNIGARVDYFSFAYVDKLAIDQSPSQSKAIISPKWNVNYTLNPKWQFYFKSGRGFHSNDARVVVPNKGRQILPAAHGSDIGLIAKPIPNLFLNISAWYLFLQNEFVYVGDEAIIEASGRTRRIGIDASAHYQINKNFILDANVNLAKPRSIENVKGEDFIPLAPTLTSTGGFTYKSQKGINGSIRYRSLKNRPANETNTVIAEGYTVIDATLSYTKKQYEIGLSIENILNTKWNEAQFNTTSRLQNEPLGVEELHFTPGVPFFAKLKITFSF